MHGNIAPQAHQSWAYVAGVEVAAFVFGMWSTIEFCWPYVAVIIFASELDRLLR